MKKLMIMLLMAMPVIASAQDNTWERVEVTPAEKANKDARYLVENAVPEVDGKVCWTTTIQAPGKSAQQIYDILGILVIDTAVDYVIVLQLIIQK